jgi:hypothetical protein
MRVMLEGDFSQADLKKIAATLREIEQVDTSKHYFMGYYSEEKVNVVDIYPKVDGVDVDITVIPWPKK